MKEEPDRALEARARLHGGGQAKMAPRGSRMAPRAPKMATKWPQEDPERLQDSPDRSQDGAQKAQNGPNRPQDASRSKVVVFFAPLGPPKGPQEPLKLDTWDPPKVTTVTRILHFFTFEAMSRQESKVGRLKAGEEGLLGSLALVLWVPNRPCGGG